MDLDSIIKKRSSVRSFRNEYIPEALINRVLEAGRLAPSACNNQPWVFIVVSDTEVLKRLHEAYSRDWFVKAKQVIVACGNHQQSWKRASDGKDHCDIDVAIAVDHMTLIATELGLGTCWVCNFNPEVVKEALQLPDHIEPLVLLQIGFPVNSDVAVKKRKSFDEIVFKDRYC